MNSQASHASAPVPQPRRFGMDEPMHPVQIAGFRKMIIGRKLEIVTMMREAGMKLRIAGLRMRHPDWPGEKLETEARKAAMYASTDWNGAKTSPHGLGRGSCFWVGRRAFGGAVC